MEIKWHGTASVEVISESGRILFDPFVPLEGSDVSVSIADFDGIDDIFVTHGHFDHIRDLPEICRRNPDARVYCTKTPRETLIGKGVEASRLILIDYGQTLNINGFKITVLHGKHAKLAKLSVKRCFDCLTGETRRNVPVLLRGIKQFRENDETVFYRIEADGKSVELMGSLNLRDDCEYPTGCDALVLPYNGWKDNLPPAVNAIERLRPEKVFLDHYDNTFPPATEPLDLNPILEKYCGRVEKLTLNKIVQI